MKKIFSALLIITAAASLFVACGSAPAVTDSEILGADGIPRPDWVRKGKYTADVHYEVGYGKLSNFATSKTRAEADARDKIALWVKADVNVCLKNYTQDSGISEEREVIEFMENVSVQSAKLNLSGATIEDVWEDADGGVYVLMAYGVDHAALHFQETFDTAVKSYVRNESAAFAEFKANEAFRALEASKASDSAN